MTSLPIYSQLECAKRAPFAWEELHELMQIANTIRIGSRYRKIPTKRRNRIENSGEWPLDDGRILTIRNTGNTTSYRPEYALSIIRPGGKGPDATVHSIVLKDTEFMPLRAKPDAIAALHHIMTATQDALTAIEHQRFAPADLIREATAAMLYRPSSAPLSHIAVMKISHRTPWQDPRDILDEDGSVEYRPPQSGLATISVQVTPFQRTLELGAFTMNIKHPSLIDPLERMASIQKLEELSLFASPQ